MIAAADPCKVPKSLPVHGGSVNTRYWSVLNNDILFIPYDGVLGSEVWKLSILQMLTLAPVATNDTDQREPWSDIITPQTALPVSARHPCLQIHLRQDQDPCICTGLTFGLFQVARCWLYFHLNAFKFVRHSLTVNAIGLI